MNEIFGPNEYWTCGQCHPKHFGATCSRFRCANDCHGHGHCLDADVCSCLRGHAGKQCEHDRGCSGHGQCQVDGSCICDVGWRSRADGRKGCEWDCPMADVAESAASVPGRTDAPPASMARVWTPVPLLVWVWRLELLDAHGAFKRQQHVRAQSREPRRRKLAFVDLMRESRAWTASTTLTASSGSSPTRGVELACLHQ